MLRWKEIDRDRKYQERAAARRSLYSIYGSRLLLRKTTKQRKNSGKKRFPLVTCSTRVFLVNPAFSSPRRWASSSISIGANRVRSASKTALERPSQVSFAKIGGHHI